MIAGGEVVLLSSSSREGKEGGGLPLVIVVIVKDKGAEEERRRLREREGRGTLSVCRCRCRAALVTCGRERGAGGATTTIAGWEVVSSSSLKVGEEGVLSSSSSLREGRGGGTLSGCRCRATFHRAAWETMWGREGGGGTEMTIAGGEVVSSSSLKGRMRGEVRPGRDVFGCCRRPCVCEDVGESGGREG